ncbi:MAG: hypothetical protein ABJA79_04310, partial [Parafilimonas sp.]
MKTSLFLSVIFLLSINCVYSQKENHTFKNAMEMLPFGVINLKPTSQEFKKATSNEKSVMRTTDCNLFIERVGTIKEEYAYSVVTASDGGYIVAGYTNGDSNGGYDGLITKIDEAGNTIWSKSIGGAGDDYFYRIANTSDGGYVACGRTLSYSGGANGVAWLVKTDAQGNTQWSTRYDDGNVYGSIAYFVIQTSDGGYAISGTNRFAGGVADAMIIKTDNMGNGQWNKIFDSYNSDDAMGILEDNGAVVISSFQYGQSNSRYDGVLMKLDVNSGMLMWAKSYDIDNKSNWFASIKKTIIGYGIVSLDLDGWNATDNPSEVAVNVDTNGVPQSIRRVTGGNPLREHGGFTSNADGGFVMSQYSQGNTSDLYLYKADGQGNIEWKKKVHLYGQQVPIEIKELSDGGFIIVGANNNSATVVLDSFDVGIIRTDVNGAIACATSETDVNIEEASYSYQPNFTWNSINSVTFSVPVSITVSSKSTGIHITQACKCEVNSAIMAPNQFENINKLSVYPV